MLRVPLEVPVVNAFGAMTTRPALFVRVAAADGAYGWGEVWCNFPTVGGEHRARLIESVFAALARGADTSDPAAVRGMLERRTRTLSLQSDEPGPFAQVIGALDQACHDLAARRAGQPLWRYLGGAQGRVPVYASGIGPDRVVDIARAKHREGYRAFKLKVGMDAGRDRENLAALRAALGAQALLMVDANQGWSAQEAQARIAELAPHRPHWVEEPIAADAPHDAWEALARAGVPLAAGENLRGEAQFAQAIERRYLRFVQPDVGKWGGVSGALWVAKRAAANGAAFCPHWLAGGIGLAASMHVLAAAGGEGLAEIDANDNPLRSEVFSPEVSEGWARLPEGPGLGVEPDLARLERYRVRA